MGTQNIAASVWALFQRHMLAMQVAVEHESRRENHIFSGFLLNYRGFSFWITAGHVVDELERLRRSLPGSIRACRWHDRYADDRASSVPTSLERFLMKSVDRDGVDLGLVWLEEYDRAALTHDRLVAFDERAWDGIADAPFSRLYLLGYPKEWREDRFTKSGGLVTLETDACFACVPILELLASDACVEPAGFWGHRHCIYGRIPVPSVDGPNRLLDIEYMSGGPVIGVIRRGGRFEYRLVGLQSAWLPESGIIRAVRIELVKKAIDDVVSQYELRREESAAFDETSRCE